jgi:tripartite-type tricarboxylate transporter receptor subunit TctC
MTKLRSALTASLSELLKCKGHTRRALVAGLLAAATLNGAASAQDYPTRPVKWIVSFPAGGPNDIIARLIGQHMSETLGQQIVIENKAGAGGNVGMHAVAISASDGYTLGFIAPNNAINATLYEKIPFDFQRDIASVGGLVRTPNVLVVHPSVPAKTVAEFIAYAKANPGKINIASSGIGTSLHMSGELFQVMTGIKLVHVPYRGSAPALIDLTSGQVPAMFDSMVSSIQHIRSGSLRALGVTTAKRSPALPDVPAIGETVPGYEASIWYGVGVPKGTPPAIIEKLNAAVNVALADPKIKARLADLGCTPFPTSPNEFQALIASEIDKWAKVIKSAGLKIE